MCVLATMSRNVLKTLKSKEQSIEKYKTVHASLIKKKHTFFSLLVSLLSVRYGDNVREERERVLIVSSVRECLCVSMCGCVCVSHHHTAETAGGGSFSERLSHFS